MSTVGLEGFDLHRLAGFHSEESALYVEADLHLIFGNVLSKIYLIDELVIDEHVPTCEPSRVGRVEADIVRPEAGFWEYLNHTCFVRRLIYLSIHKKVLINFYIDWQYVSFGK